MEDMTLRNDHGHTYVFIPKFTLIDESQLGQIIVIPKYQSNAYD